MKPIALILSMILISSALSAQTADKYLQIQFMGSSGGSYKVQVKNLQNCKADFEIKFQGSATSISPNWKNNINHNEIPALSACVYTITGALTEIKVKSLSICNWAGQSPIWLILNNAALPVTIKAIRITVIKN